MLFVSSYLSDYELKKECWIEGHTCCYRRRLERAGIATYADAFVGALLVRDAAPPTDDLEGCPRSDRAHPTPTPAESLVRSSDGIALVARSLEGVVTGPFAQRALMRAVSSSKSLRNVSATGPIGWRIGSMRTRSSISGGSTIMLIAKRSRSKSDAIIIPGKMLTQSVLATRSSAPNIELISKTRRTRTPFEAR